MDESEYKIDERNKLSLNKLLNKNKQEMGRQ